LLLCMHITFCLFQELTYFLPSAQFLIYSTSWIISSLAPSKTIFKCLSVVFMFNTCAYCVTD
jgi:hypothetical protein